MIAKAIKKDGRVIQYVRLGLVTEELCRQAVTSHGKALEYAPEQFRTKELFFAAAKQDGEALRLVDVAKVSPEEYTELCKLALEREKQR